MYSVIIAAYRPSGGSRFACGGETAVAEAETERIEFNSANVVPPAELFVTLQAWDSSTAPP